MRIQLSCGKCGKSITELKAIVMYRAKISKIFRLRQRSLSCLTDLKNWLVRIMQLILVLAGFSVVINVLLLVMVLHSC